MKTRYLALLLLLHVVPLPIVVPALGAAAATAPPGTAGPDGTIALYNVVVNPDGSAGDTDFVRCGSVTSLFGGTVGKLILRAYAHLAGASVIGIAGVEFYVDGLEASGQLAAGWTKAIVTPANTLVLGDLTEPHAAGGFWTHRVNITWLDVTGPDSERCQKGPLALLAQIELQNIGFTTDFAPNHLVSVLAGSPPTNPTFECPVAILCDYPVFTAVCMTGDRFAINPTFIDCFAPVSSATWSQVKAIYR